MTKAKFYSGLGIYVLIWVWAEYTILGHTIGFSIGKGISTIPTALLVAFLLCWVSQRFVSGAERGKGTPAQRRSFLFYLTGILLALSFWGQSLSGSR